jgi:hypothetical protein
VIHGLRDDGPRPGCDCAWCRKLRAAYANGFTIGFVAGLVVAALVLAVAFESIP